MSPRRVRILRSLAVGSVFGASLLAIGFVCVDRIDHPAPAAVPALVRAGLSDPVATGALAPSAAVPRPEKASPLGSKPVVANPVVPKATDGFDTERLNALMRGDPSVTLSRTR